MKKAIILITLITLIKTNCEIGCLRCSKTGKCEICDATQFYKKEKSSCLKQTKENCEIMNSSGECIQCKTNYMPQDQNCTSVIKTIINCEIYDKESNCVKCKNGFYLKDKGCVQVGKLIINCKQYFNADECLKCEQNYVLDKNRSVCILGEGEQYCQVYSKVKCEVCEKGYIINYGIESNNFFRFGNESSLKKVEEFYLSVFYDLKDYNFSESCEKIVVTNCLFPKTAKTCFFCKLGYFLRPDETCERFPIPRTDFCVSYNPIYECVECENGYFLTDKKCKANEPIENCILYNGKASITECLGCNGEYYVNGGKCEKRDKSVNIQNCLENNVIKDKCSECSNSFVLSSDALKCFNEISQCERYSNNSSTSDAITCSQCKPRYFVKTNKTCELGDIPNCKIYNNENICSSCDDGYYLFNGKCEKHEDIVNCTNYSDNQKNICNECKNNYFHFKFSAICEESSEIDKCFIYSGEKKEKCIQCIDGFELKNEKCELISIENCLSIQNGICTSCTTDHALDYPNNSVPQCSKLPETILQNCKKTSLNNPKNTSSVLESFCISCEKDSIPLDHREQFICIKNSNLYIYGIDEDNQVPNCLKYDINRKCIQCISPKFLNSDGLCVDSCAEDSEGTFYRLQIGSSSTNNFVIKGYNICDEIQIDVYCNIAGPTPSNSYTCIKCLPEFIDVVLLDNDNQYSLVEPFQNELPFVISPLAKFSEVSCVKGDENSLRSINGDTGNSFVNNCHYYKSISKSGSGDNVKYDYGCIKCMFGFNGGVNLLGYIEECIEMSDCGIEKRYGLDSIWEKLVSCHKCNSNEEIPFLMIKTISKTNPTPEKFAPYNFATLNWTNNGNPEKNNIQCLTVSKETFGYPAEDDKFKLPENCGFGVVNLNYQDGDTTNNSSENPSSTIDKLAIYCGACKPMYRPDPLSFVYNFVKIRCSPIENCLKSSWFNVCSECQTGYVYEWREDSIDYAKCVLNPIEGCFAALFISNENSICRACKRGYNLNQDFFCEKLTPPNCESSVNFNSKTNYFAHPFYSYYHNQRGIGCEKCKNGFTAVEVGALSKNNFVCTKSNYLETKSSNLPDNTNFIPNCEYYSLENNLLHCENCMIGHLLLEEQGKKSCILAPQNCEELLNSVKCKECSEGYALVNNNCEKGTIQNCLAYKQTNQSVQICDVCVKEHYLSLDGNCELGMVRNCEKLTSLIPTKCIKCLEGFFLIKKSKLDYCYPKKDYVKCNEMVIGSTSNSGGQIQCKSCIKPNQFLNSIPTQKTICLEFTKVENCEEYDKDSSLDGSSFLCKKCKDDYYLDLRLQICKKREYTNPNCLEFFPIIDKCQKCAINTILTYKGECESLPSGITSCIQYKNANECTLCTKNRFLENNKCNEVREDLKMQNCMFYKAEGECQKCEKDYYLTGNECLLASAKNCKTYTDIATCKECEKEKGLILDTKGYLNCETITKSNCKEFFQEENFPCKICNTNYYPDSNGDCIIANKLIDGCIEYESENKCTVCKKDRALSRDKAKCEIVLSVTNDFDRNCSVYRNTLKCSMCRPGAYFHNGQCVLCEDSLGCFRCDSKDGKVCEMCYTGYHMKVYGKCVRDVSEVANRLVDFLNQGVSVFGYLIFFGVFFV